MPERLPIYEIEREVLKSLARNNRLLLTAPTGSGKSTQVPQILLDGGALGDGQVVILQPRRLAARLLATRVAAERHCKLGGEVGYQIRFENVTGRETRIRFVTEGVLLRQMIAEPKLGGISALIFDEFHERHLYGDITLAQALEVQTRHRPELKILVMSATLDVQGLEEYLKPCALLQSQGRTFPVQIEFANTPAYMDKRPIWEQAAAASSEFVSSGEPGDLLVFMPGGFEIAQTIDALRRHQEARDFLLLPLHGELPPKEQDAAVARYERRKVVVATNVAETSLTIDGIRCVIDSGLARIPRYDPYRGINTLLVEKISRASAEQRAGRAGRTAPGLCKRLWSREEHAHRLEQEPPEVKRLDLAEVVLTLKAAGINDLRAFRWLEPPDEQALVRAEEMLLDLGALEKHEEPAITNKLSAIGRKMLAFPVHPRYARMLLAAKEFGCVHEACLLAALTQGRELLLRNTEPGVQHTREDLAGNSGSDFELLMQVWQHVARDNFNADTCRRLGVHATAARQVKPLFEQFLEIARREKLDASSRDVPSESLRKCILLGFSDRVAHKLDVSSLRCALVHGRRGTLARESAARSAELFVAAEVREVQGKEQSVSTVLSLASPIEMRWLEELFPADISKSPKVYYDASSKRVYGQEELCFRDLVISSRRVEPPPTEPAAQLLAQEVLAGRLQLNQWDENLEQWILRLNLLNRWCPELNFPPIGPEERKYLVEQICHGAFRYKDIKDKPVSGIVKSWLSAPQLELVEKHAPERLRLSNGRTPKVTYEPSNPPHVALRIQELYDVSTTPKIAMGRVPVLLHILAPSRRPVQITQDLPGFWREHYPRIKQELQRKYPKHEWR